MKCLKIREIIDYGRYYSSEEYNIIDPLYWLKVSNYKIYDGEELIERKKVKNAEDLRLCGKYIPLFKTDIDSLYAEFVRKHYPEVQNNILEIVKSDPDYDYGTAFRIYFEATEAEKVWWDFEEKRLKEDAIQWCRDNKLSYAL